MTVVKDIKEEIINLLFNEFIESLDSKIILCEKLPIHTLMNVQVLALNISDDSEKYIKGNELFNDNNKELLENIKKKLIGMKSPFFHSTKSIAINNSFFDFIMSEKNVDKVWGLFNSKMKREIFDIQLKRYSGKNIKGILSILKPEDYSKIFRLNLNRESIYLAKESFTFLEKIERIQKIYSDQEMVNLINNIYNNVDDVEKNILVTFVKDEKSKLKQEVREQLNLTYKVDNKPEILEELKELFGLNKVKVEQLNFEFYFDKKVLRNIFNGLASDSGIEQLFHYIQTNFKYNDEHYEITSRMEFGEFSKVKNKYNENHVFSCRIIRNTPFTEEEKKEREDLLKRWFIKICDEDLLSILSADKTNYKCLNEKKAFIKFDEVIKELRQDLLIKTLDIKRNNETKRKL